MCFPTSHQSTVEPWFLERQMRSMEIGSIEDCFPGHDVEPFPYSKTFEQAEWAPLVVLHTSGSTGLPKPIVVKQVSASRLHWYCWSIGGVCSLGSCSADFSFTKPVAAKRRLMYNLVIGHVGHRWCISQHSRLEWASNVHPCLVWNVEEAVHALWGSPHIRPRGELCLYLLVPLFHAGGLYLFLIRAVYWGNPVALGIVDRPLSPDLVAECLDNLDVEGALIA